MMVMRQVKELRGLCQYRYTQNRHHTQNDGDETGEGTEGALSVQVYTEQTPYPE